MTVVIWIALIWYCSRTGEKYAVSINSLLPTVPVVGLLYVLNNFIRSEFLRKIYIAGGFSINRMESFLSVFVASSLNYVIPFKAGSLYRAYYLRKAHDFEYRKFASTLMGFTLHAAFAAIVLTLSAMIAVGFFYDRWDWYLLAILSIILVSIIVLSRSEWRKIGFIDNTSIGRLINKLLDDTKSIMNHYVLQLYALISVLLLTISNGLSLFIVLDVLDTEGQFMPLCLLALTQTLAGFASLTPGAVGVQEAAAALVYGIVSIPPDKIILAVFSIRVIKILTISILIYPVHSYLYRPLGERK